MIPASAVERYRKLQDRADESRDASLATYEAMAELRDQIGKALLSLQRHSRGHRLDVEADGSVVIVGRQPPPLVDDDGNVEISAPVTVPFDDRYAAGGSAASAQREAREIGRMKERLGRVQSRSAELSARVQTFSQLAEAAAELLADRGWADDDRVRGLVGVTLPAGRAA